MLDNGSTAAVEIVAGAARLMGADAAGLLCCCDLQTLAALALNGAERRSGLDVRRRRRRSGEEDWGRHWMLIIHLSSGSVAPENLDCCVLERRTVAMVAENFEMPPAVIMA